MHLSSPAVIWVTPLCGQENNAQLGLRLGKRQVTLIDWNLEPGNRHLTSLSFWVKMQEVPLVREEALRMKCRTSEGMYTMHRMHSANVAFCPKT